MRGMHRPESTCPGLYARMHSGAFPPSCLSHIHPSPPKKSLSGIGFNIMQNLTVRKENQQLPQAEVLLFGSQLQLNTIIMICRIPVKVITCILLPGTSSLTKAAVH